MFSTKRNQIKKRHARVCGSKQQYRDKEIAEWAITTITNFQPREGKVLVAYLCTTCDMWHIGHTSA